LVNATLAVFNLAGGLLDYAEELVLRGDGDGLRVLRPQGGPGGFSREGPGRLEVETGAVAP